MPGQGSVGLEGAGGPGGSGPEARNRGAMWRHEFRLRARHRRRHHRAGVVIPARLRLKWTLSALAIGQFKKKKGKWWVGAFSVGPPDGTGVHVLYFCVESTWAFHFLSCGIFVGSSFSHFGEVAPQGAKRPSGRPAVPPSSCIETPFYLAARDRMAILFFVEGTPLPVAT